ncbi:MAG TPA: sodium-dependent bicarbonate transport family permease [Parachlamydiales bacterium]|nr:sodium-dependent bicarbonate transport family permease [Parachlamydiales bacterium]
MNFLSLIAKNIFNLPLLSFMLGIFFTLIRPGWKLPIHLNKLLTIYILFCIGLKGGGPLIEHSFSSAFLFFSILTALVIWGFLHPFLSFYLVRSFSRMDCPTAAAIAASFGSVSVMTFITAVSFLDQIQINYEKLIVAVLAVMEIPAIISAIFIAKIFDKSSFQNSSSFFKILYESLFNKAIVAIFVGMLAGSFFYWKNVAYIGDGVLIFFKPFLCLFLFDMGIRVGMQRSHFQSFPPSLHLFGVYMPLIGGIVGLIFSYVLGLDPGTGTLISVLTASASYIAVPAAMRIALPQANEAVYLPLSLGIAFPFNVIAGIPLYYYLARSFLN